MPDEVFDTCSLQMRVANATAKSMKSGRTGLCTMREQDLHAGHGSWVSVRADMGGGECARYLRTKSKAASGFRLALNLKWPRLTCSTLPDALMCPPWLEGTV